MFYRVALCFVLVVCLVFLRLGMVRAYPRVSDSLYFRWDLILFISSKDVDDPYAFPLRTRDCSPQKPWTLRV